MRETVKCLEEILGSWAVDAGGESSYRKIPEVDWRKMRSLNFQEALQSRGALEKKNSNRSCLICPDFDVHVSLSAYPGPDDEYV
jgi:antiviral helicase SKI2